MQIPVVLSLLLLSISVAAAEPGPYAGQEQRAIKALSPQETQDYLDGKGMGLAKAAELNHYPGPVHVLELADKLALSADQRTRTQTIFTAMQREAQALGRRLVHKERELDRLFAGGTIDKAALQTSVREIGVLQSEIRRVHLQAHLKQRAILTPDQVAAYDRLRGYTDTGHTASPAAHGHLH